MKKVYMIVFFLGVVLGVMAHAAGLESLDPNLANHSVAPGSSSASSMAMGESCPSGACFITACSAPIGRLTVNTRKSALGVDDKNSNTAQ